MAEIRSFPRGAARRVASLSRGTRATTTVALIRPMRSVLRTIFFAGFAALAAPANAVPVKVDYTILLGGLQLGNAV